MSEKLNRKKSIIGDHRDDQSHEGLKKLLFLRENYIRFLEGNAQLLEEMIFILGHLGHLLKVLGRSSYQFDLIVKEIARVLYKPLNAVVVGFLIQRDEEKHGFLFSCTKEGVLDGCLNDWRQTVHNTVKTAIVWHRVEYLFLEERPKTGSFDKDLNFFHWRISMDTKDTLFIFTANPELSHASEETIGLVRPYLIEYINNVRQRERIENEIMERKRTETALRESEEKLKQLNRFKDDFVSTVSHELRTPLTTIKAFTSILSDDDSGRLTRDHYEYIGIIKGNVDRLTRLVEDLLDFSGIEAGKIRLRKTIKRIEDLAKYSVDMLKTMADEKNIIVKTTVSDDLPDVFLDPDRITQALTNLISNAIKFTPKKGIITVEIMEKKDRIECSIIDNGKGIAPENLDKVFEKFQQIDRTSGPGYRGTGLGLAITKKIVEMHEGTIRVESVLNKGSKFVFTLPKLNSEEMIYHNLENRIAEVLEEGKELIVLIFKLNKIVEKQKHSNKKNVFRNILEKFKNKLDADILVMPKNERELVVCAKVENSNGSVIYIKIKKAFKDVLRDIDEKFAHEFSSGASFYSQKTKNSHELLDEAYKNLRNEQEEQFKKKIMIVDDESMVTKILERKLRKLGYSNLSIAHSGEEALQEIKDSIPDLLTLDMNMPKMSGYEIVGRLKGNVKTKDIPIVIMSGEEIESDHLNEIAHEQAIPIMGKRYDDNQIKKLLTYLI